jgi:hypothetical protein
MPELSTHFRLIWLEETTVAVSPLGALMTRLVVVVVGMIEELLVDVVGLIVVVVVGTVVVAEVMV